MASDRRHEGRHDTGNRYAGLLRKQYGAAGKSGTTTKNRDALFAGFTPYYTCVVWGLSLIHI